MKKLLPKTIKNPQGFTLIELLVVITIIAILSIIGLALFTGVQARARNTKRRSEVTAIAKAMEVNKDSTLSTYPLQIQPIWFAGGVIPVDSRGAAQAGYCLVSSPTSGTPMTAYTNTPPTTWVATTTACPGLPPTPPAGTSVVAINTPTAAVGASPAGTAISVFEICALLEGESIGGVQTVFCVPNAQ